jgi:hypothetical protein
MVDPIDYQLVLDHPDRDEPERSDFTSFEGEVEVGQILTLPEKGAWRVAEIQGSAEDRLPQLHCTPA